MPAIPAGLHDPRGPLSGFAVPAKEATKAPGEVRSPPDLPPPHPYATKPATPALCSRKFVSRTPVLPGRTFFQLPAPSRAAEPLALFKKPPALCLGFAYSPSRRTGGGFCGAVKDPPPTLTCELCLVLLPSHGGCWVVGSAIVDERGPPSSFLAKAPNDHTAVCHIGPPSGDHPGRGGRRGPPQCCCSEALHVPRLAARRVPRPHHRPPQPGVPLGSTTFLPFLSP